MEDGSEVHGHDATRTVLQHLLHGFQRARGVETVLADLLEVALQHVKHIHRVLVVLGVHVFLLVLYVGLYVLDETLGELGEVVDVVQRVQDAVDESLGELTHGGHLLESNHLGSTLLDDALQAVLVLLKLAQAPLENEVDQKSCQ